MRLFLGLCSTSARPRASRSGGMYMPKRPRRPFLRPYQPPTGLSGERPQASTVPSAAGFCSSALPSGIQSPFAFSMAWRSSMARSWYRSSVFPTRQTMAGGSSDSSRYIWYSDEPLGVFKSHGSSRVPVPWALSVAMFFLQSAKECDPSVAPRPGQAGRIPARRIPARPRMYAGGVEEPTAGEIDWVEEALLESFPASDPPAYPTSVIQAPSAPPPPEGAR